LTGFLNILRRREYIIIILLLIFCFVYVIGLSTASCSSAEMVTVGQIGNYGYGSVPMEKSFRVSLGL
jgi:hypothetical protein